MYCLSPAGTFVKHRYLKWGHMLMFMIHRALKKQFKNEQLQYADLQVFLFLKYS